MEAKTEKLKPEDTQETVKKKRRIERKGKKAIEKKTVQLAKLEIEYVGLNKLFPNDYNPNRQNEHDFELLLRSMEEDGFTQPILCHKSGEIVDGEHRWRAAQILGLKEIPVVYVDMPIEQMKISTLRHNRARGTHDMELEAQVAKDFESLGMLEWFQDSLKLDDRELQNMLEDIPAPDIFSNEEFSEAWEPEKMGQDEDVEMFEEETSNGIIFSAVTAQAIERQREKERALKKAKTLEEKEMIKKEHNLYKLYLTFSGDEAIIIKEVLGRRPAEKLLKICRNEYER